MTKVKINNLTKNFTGMERPAVDDINIEITDGDLIALLGPSGCGKTTILKMITGLIQPDKGISYLMEILFYQFPLKNEM